jgi:hypothetical protein
MPQSSIDDEALLASLLAQDSSDEESAIARSADHNPFDPKKPPSSSSEQSQFARDELERILAEESDSSSDCSTHDADSSTSPRPSSSLPSLRRPRPSSGLEDSLPRPSDVAADPAKAFLRQYHPAEEWAALEELLADDSDEDEVAPFTSSSTAAASPAKRLPPSSIPTSSLPSQPRSAAPAAPAPYDHRPPTSRPNI